MMNNLAANKSHTHCQSWADQNGWPTTSTQGSLFHPLPSSQHLSLGSSSGQQHSYNHLQTSSQGCMIDISTLSSTHHPALCKDSLSSSSSSSASLFANTAVPSSSHGISFVQQSPHTSSMQLSASQGKNVPAPPLPQPNQAPQPCGPLRLPHLSSHNPFKASFQPPLINQGLPNGLQDLPISLPSYGQPCMSQDTCEGANVEFAGVSGNSRNHYPSTSQEKHQMMPSSHCRGATNMSVPDVHPNKESSQEGNTPPANAERRRSVLLHQRAQLLQQLAELDKCLESVPPDDSGDGQPAHTALQPPPSMDDSSQCEQNKTSNTQQVQSSVGKSASEVRLSVGRSSPVSCDKQNETCDTPDDPVSEAESEKNENVSDQSEGDNDPDYFPNCHSDSDVQSDPGDSSSDESSGSSASTPEGESPSLSGKNGMLEAKSNHPPIQAQTTTHTQKVHKKSSETLVLPCSNSQVQRVYDRRNYCLFCSKPIGKMARHLESIHSDKPEVAIAFKYPKKSRERLKIWNRLINQGNFAHNKDVLKTGKGQLAVRKRPNHTREARDFLHCLYCRGFFTRKALHRHMKLCPEKVKNGSESHLRRRIFASRCVLEISDLGVSDGLKSILSKMTYNDVTQAVMDDQVILQFGELLFKQYGSDVRKHEYLRQSLRQIARLVLEAQKITPFKKLEDFFLPSSFPYVVSAVNVLAGYNAESKRYSNPSLAVKIGYHLQKVCTIVEGNAVKCGDATLAESARQFLSVYQKKWNKLISTGALTTLKETKLKKSKKVPFAQDVKRLSLHLESIHHLAEKQLRDSPSKENYVALVRVILARTVIFNKRRATEISSLQLKDFLSRKQSNLHADVGLYLSDLERSMCRFFQRVDIRGKCGRMVPVVLKPSFISAMELFVQVRETCGVPNDNPFLFGRPHALSAYNASECIQKYAKGCGAKDPEALTSVKIREHYATMLQMMSLDENEADQILGPNNPVRALRQNSSMELDDTEMDFDDRLQSVRQQDGSWTHNKHPGAKSVKSSKKGPPKISKHKWEEAEVQAVERHMMRFIQGHKVPQKNDCIQCLEAEPEALRTRSWRGVKDYVRNRITSEGNVKKSRAKDLEAQTSTKIRKHYTTLQLKDLDKNDANKALGPNNQVQIWRQNSSMQLEDVEMESDERGPEAAPARFNEQKHGARTRSNKTAPQKSVKSNKKAIQNNSKHKWEEAEVQAVERHMMRFIQGHKVPQKNDCVQCLEAEPEALRTRSWKGVKDYVRNRITSLKRQGGSSQTA